MDVIMESCATNYGPPKDFQISGVVVNVINNSSTKTGDVGSS